MSNMTLKNGRTVTWNIAQAKQQFSEVVRLSVHEPQAIYNRENPVAVLISAAEFESFQQWRTAQHEPSLTAQFGELRSALQQAGAEELLVRDRGSAQRPNAFVQMLEVEGLSRPAASS